ncbi:MAG TPA: hypothetical protein VF510_06910 [Ktedonobacterales bacterium]
MRARIGGGIAGWLIGVVPLIVVNALDYQGLFAFQDAVVAGLVALIGGIVLGGIVAGLLGGRAGGTTSATAAGAVAAVLYAATLISLVIGTGILDSASPLIALHPLRISMALVFLATILLAIAIATGAIVGRHANAAPTASPTYHSIPLNRTPQAPYDTYRRHPPSQPHTQSRPRDAASVDSHALRDTRNGASYGNGASRPLPPDASDPRYATSRSRPASSSGSRRDQRPPSSHESDWRRPGR